MVNESYLFGIIIVFLLTGLSVFSSGFLLWRGWYCWLCYIGVPLETNVSEFGFAFGTVVQILTNETNHDSCWTSWKGLRRRGHFLYLFWIKNGLFIGKSYPLKLLESTQNHGKCFYCLYSMEYSTYSFCCCVILFKILFRLVKENHFRIFNQSSVWTLAWGSQCWKVLSSLSNYLYIIWLFCFCSKWCLWKALCRPKSNKMEVQKKPCKVWIGKLFCSDSSKTLRKLCVSTKFPHQEMRWNFCILLVLICKCLRDSTFIYLSCAVWMV